MGKTKHFEVPIVLQNLPPAETLNQICDALHLLNKAVDEAFDSISTEVKAERDHIQILCSRVAYAQFEVDIIAKHPNRATTVYSASNYPGKQNVVEDHPLIDVIHDEVRPTRPKYRLPLEERGKRSRPVNTLSLFERLGDRTSSEPQETPVGVGHLPSYLPSVADCLLFNTNVNPYVKYSVRDNLDTGTEVKERERPTKKMGPQPRSIEDAHLDLDVDDGDWNYQPVSHAAPIFVLPTNIPGLDDLALDEAWCRHDDIQTDELKSLAPSAKNVSSFPDVEQEILDSVPRPPDALLPEEDAPIADAQDPVEIIILEVPVLVVEDEEKLAVVPETPAPRPVVATRLKPVQCERAAFLKEIRNPAKKLKKASERKIHEKRPTPENVDLMGLLERHMVLRNALISGQFDGDSDDEEDSDPDWD